MAELFTHGWSIWPAMVAALVARRASAGRSTACSSRVLGLPSLAVTIGTLTLFRGIAQVILPTDTIGGFPTALGEHRRRSRCRGTQLPWSILFFLVLAVLVGVVLHLSPLGRSVFAIGAGHEAAFFAGIRVKRIKFCLFVLSGLLAGSRGSSGRCGSPRRATTPASGQELLVVTIVLLGGVSIFGGRGTIFGVVLAVAILGLLQTAMTLALVSSQDQNIVVGGLLIMSVIVPERRRPLPARAAAIPEPRGAQATRRAAARGGRVKPRVGVFGIGLAAYWPQFEGLRERLEGYQRGLEAKLAELGADVVSAGLVDTPEAAREAGERLAAGRVELIMLYTATYATSSQVLPAVQAAKAPVVVLNLQPTRSLDYERMTTGEWLANCSACCVPELAGAFTRARVPYSTVTGTLLDGDPAWDVLGDWVAAASAVQSLRAARLGFLGHTYPGMLDMYSDFTQVHAQTGAHVEVLEMDDLVARVEAADEAALEAKGAEIRALFDLADPGADPIADEITPESFAWSARVAVGLDRLVDDFALDGLTYYYRGVDGNVNERVTAGLIVGNSLLTARGVPAAGEGDLKTNVAMLLLDRLGAGGSYTEFYALDFDEGFVLMGHDGPGHVAIADGRPVVRALKLYHGKSGAGLSVEFKVRLGPVTILGVTQTADGRLKLIAAEGEAVEGPTFRIGNTNSRIRFALGPGGLHGRLVRGGADAPRRARRRPRLGPDPQGRRICSGSSSRSSSDDAYAFSGPTPTRTSRASSVMPPSSRSRPASSSSPDRPERPLLLEPDPSPAGRRRCGRRLHVRAGARLGAPRRRLRPAARRLPGARERRLRRGRLRRASAGTATAGAAASAIRSARGRCWRSRSTASRTTSPTCPAVLEAAGVEVPRRPGTSTSRPRAVDRADRTGVARLRAARHRRVAHDVHRLRDAALVVRRRDFEDGRCAIASPARCRRPRTSSRRSRGAGPADWLEQRWYELALDFARGRYALLVDSDHYVAYFEDPASRSSSARSRYAPPPVGPTGSRRPNLWTWSVVMNSRVRDRDAAWRFVEWATGREFLLRSAFEGNMNPTRSQHLGRRALPRAHRGLGRVLRRRARR